MKNKWWLVLCLTSSFALSGCGDSGSSNPNTSGAVANQFATPANLQPLETQLQQVGIRFIASTVISNGQQVTAPSLDIAFFNSFYPGLAYARGIEQQYVMAVQQQLTQQSNMYGSNPYSGSQYPYNTGSQYPYTGNQYPYGTQQQVMPVLDSQTYFNLSVKLNIVQGLMNLSH